MATTQMKKVCYPRERASRCLFQSTLILNLLKRMSSLVTLEIEQKTINEETLASSHYVTNQSKVWSHFKCAGH